MEIILELYMNETMRLSCIDGYEWPEELLYCTDVLNSLDGKIDFEIFYKKLNSYNRSEDIIITFLSKEYLGIGKIWLRMIERINTKQFIVISTDSETALFLDLASVPHCKVNLNLPLIENKTFKSRIGFTEKGLAITALKYPIVKLLIKEGFNVLLVDIDALLLKKPPKEYFLNVDIAFQRILYHPKPVAMVWGFAACSGFVWFRSNEATFNLIENALKLQLNVYCDQIALNVALWECEMNWFQPDYNAPELSDDEFKHRINIFKIHASDNIDGIGIKLKIKARALPPKLFWRNNFVDFDSAKAILFHPNSPKEESGKLQALSKYYIINS